MGAMVRAADGCWDCTWEAHSKLGMNMVQSRAVGWADASGPVCCCHDQLLLLLQCDQAQWEMRQQCLVALGDPTADRVGEL